MTDSAEVRPKFTEEIRRRMGTAVLLGAMGRIDRDLPRYRPSSAAHLHDERGEDSWYPDQGGYFHVVRWNPDAPPTVIPDRGQRGDADRAGQQAAGTAAGRIFAPRTRVTCGASRARAQAQGFSRARARGETRIVARNCVSGGGVLSPRRSLSPMASDAVVVV